ncbi:MAG TPA: hypothetical protein DCG54_07450 [Anaerolineae bacterium]|jgi:hypothetical protein|nr:hypothetical protein [Anaerolineae bacterium]
MKYTSQTRANFVEMQTDGQMAAWRAALATLATVIERYQQGIECEDLQVYVSNEAQNFDLISA